MQRNYEYDYYSNNYNMDEYLERLDRIQRMPSLLGEYPSFPNVHEVLHNEPAKKVSDKKVHFVEHGKKKPEVGKIEVKEKSIDAEADGFIKQKRKGFSLCKWDTYKGY